MTSILVSRRTLLQGAAAAAACSALPGFRPPARAAAGRPVNVFLGTTPDFANVWVGQVKGFFAEAGIEAKIRLFPSGSAASDAFRTGEAQFLGCGDVPAVRLWKTMGTRYLTPISRDFYSPVLVVKREIRSGADLKGKTIATQTASSFMLMVEEAAKKFGLAKGDFKVTNMEPTDMVIALDRGDVDGFVWASPFEERAKQVSGDKVHVLVRGDAVNYPNSIGLSTRRDLLEKDPALVKGFVTALAKASDWCMANKEETSDIIGKQLKLEPKIAAVTQKMNFKSNIDQPLWRYFLALDRYLVARGVIDKPIDWSQYHHTQFLREIDPSRVEPIPQAG